MCKCGRSVRARFGLKESAVLLLAVILPKDASCNGCLSTFKYWQQTAVPKIRRDLVTKQACLLVSVIMKTVRHKVLNLWCLRTWNLLRGFRQNTSFRSDRIIVLRDTMRRGPVLVNHNRKVEYNNYSRNKKCKF